MNGCPKRSARFHRTSLTGSATPCSTPTTPSPVSATASATSRREPSPGTKWFPPSALPVEKNGSACCCACGGSAKRYRRPRCAPCRSPTAGGGPVDDPRRPSPRPRADQTVGTRRRPPLLHRLRPDRAPRAGAAAPRPRRRRRRRLGNPRPAHRGRSSRTRPRPGLRLRRAIAALGGTRHPGLRHRRQPARPVDDPAELRPLRVDNVETRQGSLYEPVQENGSTSRLQPAVRDHPGYGPLHHRNRTCPATVAALVPLPPRTSRKAAGASCSPAGCTGRRRRLAGWSAAGRRDRLLRLGGAARVKTLPNTWNCGCATPRSGSPEYAQRYDAWLDY